MERSVAPRQRPSPAGPADHPAVAAAKPPDHGTPLDAPPNAAARWRVVARRCAVPLLFAALALAFVGQGLVPGQALLPIDNLFLYPPWRAHAAEFGVDLPHNPLIGDAILQNYSWKRFAAESYAAGRFPLWNPYILAGQPFLATAQNGSLYPLGVLFFLLPLPQAYGWFIGLHLWMAALYTYWFVLTLGAGRVGGIVAGLTFAFCGYLVVSFLWPMVVSTAIWLPALLAVIELLIRRANPSPLTPPRSSPRAVWESGPGGGGPILLPLGATIVGMQFLAGHVEMSLYLLLTAGFYTAFRLCGELRRTRQARRLVAAGASALFMVALGTGLAAIQLVPFAEVIGRNVRTGWSDYAETVGYALPRERAIAFVVPDYFGNPSHHTYLDLLTGEIRSVEHVRSNGERRNDTEWSGKNYVEGTVYLGILPLLLAVVGLLALPRGAGALAAVAVVALLLAFGTPLYAVLYYGVPGVNQLHTPFRWIYPFGLCVAALAGLGATVLFDRGASGECPRRALSWSHRLASAAVLAGIALLLALLVALVARDAAVEFAARALRRWSDLRAGFGEARVLFSYQYLNLVASALLLTVAGLLLLLTARRRSPWLGAAAIILLVGDLFSFGIGFNTVASTRPLDFVPATIQAIRQDPDLFRVVTYGEDDTLPSNTNMLFGLQDVRGYDTVILREYIDYLELIEPQRGIDYSKVAKLFDQRSLSSPLLDLLNVRYVVTSKTVSQPAYTLVGQGDGLRVYRNERALPRAFVVSRAVAAPDRAAALELVGNPAFDPRQTVILEAWSGQPRLDVPSSVEAEIVSYESDRVAIRASAPSGGFLVLGDVFFDGWTATVDGAQRPILRANGLFRAVELDPGPHDVVFQYRPLSFRIGALASFVAAVGVGLLGLLAAWRRFGGGVEPTTPVGRVVKNSAFPLATGLVNKLVDVGFALVMFRVLQAEGVGAYTFAGVVVGYLEIVVGFGLGTLITREVARERAQAGHYLANALGVRLLLWVGSLLVVAIVVGPLAGPLGITPPLALTIWLLIAALLPGLLSSALSALFMAHERMELPAIVTVLTTLLKVSLGLVALLLGWGYVGLAGVSLIANIATAGILLGLYIATIGRPRLSFDPELQRWMLATSLPLMLNGLLNSLFFRIDALLLKPLAGDLALGWYSTAYKFIDGLQIIPSSFVLAVFPLLSQHAGADRSRLVRTTAAALKVLLILALPIAVGTTLLAEPIIRVFAGEGFLPESAQALQILIWFLPFSFVNGLVQYVLIALNRQRAITAAFVLGAAFNLAANLALIPSFGYLAASWVTVASELVLLVPFLWVVRSELGGIGLLGLAWRPTVAALLMAWPVSAVASWNALLAIPAGALVYGLALLALRTFDHADRAVLRSLLRR